jgi:VWFA-related protein
MKLTRLVFSATALSLALHAQQTPRPVALFLDLNSMDAAEQTKARDAAIEYVQTKLGPSDVTAVMTYTSQLNVLSDFSADRNSVLAVLRAIVSSDAAAGVGAAPEDKLKALETAASMLSKLADKKTLIYISGGMNKTGIDNQPQMEATINALMKANVAIYPLDTRGLLSAPR